MKNLSVIILVILATMLQAQPSMKRADVHYDLRAYSLAIPTYLETLSANPDNMEATVKLARAYREVNRHDEAVHWFRTCDEKMELSTDDLFAFGQSLKSIDAYDEARQIFLKVTGTQTRKAQHFALSCQKAQAMSRNKTAEATVLTINSQHSDFSPEVYNGELHFVSFRKDIEYNGMTAKSLAGSDALTQHYAMEIKRLNQAEMPYMPGNTIAFPADAGPFSYAETAKTVVYAKNNYVDGNRQINGDEFGVGLFIAELDDAGNWEENRPFIHNSAAYSNNYPYISEDGKVLYFSSNRSGGYGGYDLYKCDLVSGAWSNPMNLGPKVNTEGNEITPFQDKNTLYFASDWHHGLGGYDIFRASKKADKFKIANMVQLNSSLDDYGMIYSSEMSSIVLVSNRNSSRGFEDLMLFSANLLKHAVNSFAEVMPSENRTTTAKPMKTETTPPIVKQQAAVITTKPVMTHETTTVAVSSDSYNGKITLIVEDSYGNRVSDAIVDLSNCNMSNVRTNEFGKATFEAYTKCKVSVKAAGFLRAVFTVGSGYINMDGKKTVRLMKDENAIIESRTVSTSVDKAPATSVKIGERTYTGTTENKTSIPADVNTQYVDDYYSVQIASFGEKHNQLHRYLYLETLGEVFVHSEGGLSKIRVGKLETRSQAAVLLAKLKKKGYDDAFIVTGVSSMAKNIYRTPTQSKTAETVASTENYKIRLAAYTNAKWFDIDKVEDLGKIEQWTSNQYTVMILGELGSLSEVKKKLHLVKERGFRDAVIVIDQGGILKYYKD